MKLLVVSSSLFTDRILLFSTFAKTITHKASVEVWSTSYPENKELWESLGYEISAFPKVKNFNERINILRFINHHIWNYKLNATSILSMQDFVKRDSHYKNRIKRNLERCIGWFFQKIGMGVKFEIWLYSYLCKQARSAEARERLLKGKFAGVVITNPFWQHESAIGIEATKLGIPIFSFIPSWDNITTKSRLVFKSDAFAVWSKIRVDEFREYYPIHKKAPVHNVGAPQFDVFFREEMALDKISFCKSNGLSSDIPILLYCIGSPNFIKSEISTCIQSLKYFAEKGLLDSLQVLIRPHPNKQNAERESDYLSIHENIKIQNVGKNGLITEERTQSKDQIIDWVSTFKNVDYVVNLSSTVILDSAFFNKPIINIDFDCEGEKKFDSFIKYLNRNWIHLQYIHKSNAVDYVGSYEEFYQTLLRITLNPQEKTQERKAIWNLICQNERGKSGEYLAESIMRTFS